MKNNEKIIKDYFESWINNDPEIINQYFADIILYSECYGPEYQNKKQVQQWFLDWQKKGRVIEWRIKDIYNNDQKYTVEWFFKSNYDNNIEEFDGVSLIEFNDDGKIVLVKEFQSKSEHIFPYKAL